MQKGLGQLAPALTLLRIASVLMKSVLIISFCSLGFMSVHSPVIAPPTGGKIYMPTPFLLICLGQGGSALCFCSSKLKETQL